MELTKIIQSAGYDWKTDRKIETYRFPESWDVREYRLREGAVLEASEIRRAVSGRIPYKEGAAALKELAADKQNIVILVDDLSRPTPASDILGSLLDQLKEAGVAGERIRFVMSLGTHRPMSAEEIAMKLGPAAASGYVCENHDCRSEDAVTLGRTSYGTLVRVNKTVAQADLVIGIGAMTKHRFAYASGGAKIIFPGAAHLDTVIANHKLMNQPGEGYGAVRQDIHESARMLTERTDIVTVNVTVNSHGRITNLFIGDCMEMFKASVDRALESYRLDFRRADYGKSGKADIGVFRLGQNSCNPIQMLKASGCWESLCDVPIIVGDFSDRYYYDGKVHGAYKEYLARVKKTQAIPNPSLKECVERNECCIVFSPNLDATSVHISKPHWFVTSDWDRLMLELRDMLGDEKTAAFFHNASLQIVNVL